MKRTIKTLLCLGLGLSLQAQNPGPVTLPNGWSLQPAGAGFKLGDLPLNIAVSHSEKYLAVTNNGQSIQSVQLIDARNQRVLHTVLIPKAWYGIAFSDDDRKLYVSGGNDNMIRIYAVANNKLVQEEPIVMGKPWPVKISPTGLAVDSRRGRLYVVTKENNSLYTIDLNTRKIIKEQALASEAYACTLSPARDNLYISLWGADKVQLFNTKTLTLGRQLTVGDNPNELILDKKGRTLYVANANDNSVTVIDTRTYKTLEVLNTTLYPNAPEGSSTNGLALSANEKTLYVANADNNCLAVFDLTNRGRSKSKGFIPTGWYPTSVRRVGRQLFVANGKGLTSFPNPDGPVPSNKNELVERHMGDTSVMVRPGYIGGLMQGTMSVIQEPSEKTLAGYSERVYKLTPYSKNRELTAEGEPGNPVPMKQGQKSPIKYVFYIIKENRTYDQVLGDVAGGNGDTSLVLFGKNYTPNQHKLVNEFVLLDNFYADGEVSADGHNWSTSAHATDFLEKNWPTSYGGRGGSYPGEGKIKIANPKNGFIWDYAKRAGVSYRTYGEFADNGKANIPALVGHFCPYFPGFAMGIRDTVRFNAWRRDFDSLVAANALPQLNTLRFSNDHTEGLRKGAPTPFAHAADNDLAVGLFIEHLSNSPVWKESAVFIVEDDAQNGPDHVDAHRTTAYLAGPFVKRGFVDHTMYSTSSMLRTMELILGLPPMSQYDAAATPMFRSFTSNPIYTSFKALPSNVDLNDKNNKDNETARLSSQIDLSKEDRVPDQLFTEIIWKSVKGEDAIVPAPRRSAFVKLNDKDDEDDD